jgi:predicted O-methyltransferase YrrM
MISKYLTQIIEDIIKGKNTINILEIGAYEGSSTTWLINNYLHNDESSITIIEPFSTEISIIPLKKYEIFINDIKKVLYPEKVIFYKDRSICVLPTLLKDKKQYDIIFINGSYLLQDIYEDVTLCWDLLKTNGYLFIDHLAKDIFEKNKNIRCEIFVDDFKTIVKKL